MHRCCELYGLRWPDGSRRCERHFSREDRRLLVTLDRRARRRGLKRDRYGVLWPYGPNIDVESRIRMLEWAEQHDLRLAFGPWCLHWLLWGRCQERGCRHQHIEYRRNGPGWMDHLTTWQRGGAPAVLVAQPYWLSPDDRADLARLDRDPQLRVEIDEGGGWYGHGTVFVGVWRV